MKRAGTQAPSPKSAVNRSYAERQHTVVGDRRGDRPQVGKAGRKGLGGGGHHGLRLYSFPLCSVTKSYIASALIVQIRADDWPFPSAYGGERKKYEAATNGELFAFVCPLGDS